MEVRLSLAIPSYSLLMVTRCYGISFVYVMYLLNVGSPSS